ncbi:unnamed protein product [Arctia plantaginis]|uniref:Uncharacterized protein n=1 Tax=Arctia plantaginis TaxID=874455 RepID=A0A8S0ZK73_ARCPL|nr:unnamed protein product [Arctia plantaginis]
METEPMSSTGYIVPVPLPSTGSVETETFSSTVYIDMKPLPSTSCIETEPLSSTNNINIEPLPSTSFSVTLVPVSNIDSNPPPCKKRHTMKKQYFDYLSDEEDFTTIFGEREADSDVYEPTSESDDSEVGSGMTNKKKRKKSNKNNVELEHEINKVGDNAVKKRRINQKKVQRTLRQSGQAYVKRNGIEVPAKEIKPNPCTGKKCGNGCEMVTDERRKCTFEYFWTLSTVRRKDWLVSMTQRSVIKRKRSNSEKRSYSYKYAITEGEGKRFVCLQFLAATLDVGLKFIQYTVRKKIIAVNANYITKLKKVQ